MTETPQPLETAHTHQNQAEAQRPTTPSKLAVIGAGSVGSSVAYAAMLRGSARTIALYDLKKAKVDAEVLDLAHGSPLASGARIVEAVLHDEHAVLPVSSVLHDYKGISGVAMSVPSIIGRDGVVRTLDVPMDDRELARLRASASALREVQQSLGI